MDEKQPNQTDINKITQDDKEVLSKSHDIHPDYIDFLIKSGVAPDHLDEFLEARNMLSTVYVPVEINADRAQIPRHVDAPSLRSVLGAYNAAEKDIDLFFQIAEGSLSLYDKYDGYGSASRKLYAMVNRFKVHGTILFDDNQETRVDLHEAD